MIIHLFTHPIFQARNVFLICLLVAIGALGAALVAQFGFGLKPCVLCLYARIPYVVLIIISAIALLRPEKEHLVFLVLIWLCFVVAMVISFFHVGVEQHWWELSGGCPVEKLQAKTPDDMIAELLATPQAKCDEVAWRILGTSVVIWNTLLALVMNDYVLMALVALKKKNHA